MSIINIIEPEEELTDKEQAYLQGWMRWSGQNPYPKDSVLYAEYNRGYTDSMEDDARQ